MIDGEKPRNLRVEDATAFELIEIAMERCNERKLGATSGEIAREFAEAITQLEYAQMRFTRGVARQLGVFRPVDLDSSDAIADRRSFLDDAEASRGE